MRTASVFVALALLISPASAGQKSPDYFFAESFFNANYDLHRRVSAQVMLIATGQQHWVPTEYFQTKTFEATRNFQGANGLPVTGVIDRATYDRLVDVTNPLFQLWRFGEVPHPSRGRPIWMPQGMGLTPQFNKNGVSYKEPSDRFRTSYNYYPNLSLEKAFGWLLDKMRDQRTAVHYSVIKDGWFVISATTAAGFDEYLRYHEDGNGVVGFTAMWKNDNGVVYGERIAILISSSLGSTMNGRPFIEPPRIPNDLVAELRPPALQPIVKVAPPPVVQLAPPPSPAVTQQFVFNFPDSDRPVAQPRGKPQPLVFQPESQDAPSRPTLAPTPPKRYAELTQEPKAETPLPGPRTPQARIESAPGVKPEAIPAPLPTLHDEKRVALVIGNSAYKYAPEIPNPAHDSHDAAQALRELGFEVIEGQDLDYQSIRDAIRTFSDKIASADLTLFYYAGHGVQVGGKNYLVPIDAQLANAGNLDVDAINLEFILRAMETEPRTNIVILDACRDNPFTRSLKRSLSAARSVSVGTGLAPIDTQGGTLVVFATDPGNVALDGAGTRNSPFTQALLKHISTPALEVETLMKRVRRDVVEGTRGKQTPWTNSSLMREIYLVKATQ